jgi:hypothetical protein
VTWTQYAELDGLNFSVLKEGRRSMKHLQHRLKTAREDTIRLGLGRAAHCMILTPDLFPVEFSVWTGGRRAGGEWNKFCAANQGRTIIKADEYAHCIGMRDSVRAHPVAKKILEEKGEAEKVLRWQDKATEIDCKARIDWLTETTLADLKTTADLDAHRFGRLAAQYGYHVQMAFYRMGLRALGMERVVKLIAVEPLPPYDVAVFGLSDDVLWAGEEEINDLLMRVAAGRFSGLWPGRYEESEIPLELPAYCFPESDPLEGLTINSNEEEAA